MDTLKKDSDTTLELTLLNTDFGIFNSGGSYVNSYRMFLGYYNVIPNYKSIDNIDIDLFKKWFEKKYEPSIYGNPFFQSTDNFMTMQRGEIEYNPEPHNEHHDKAPFSEINHCYSFHSLYDHCRELTWFDIYNIDEVWMEIKVDYQFFRKIK